MQIPQELSHQSGGPLSVPPITRTDICPTNLEDRYCSHDLSPASCCPDKVPCIPDSTATAKEGERCVHAFKDCCSFEILYYAWWHTGASGNADTVPLVSDPVSNWPLRGRGSDLPVGRGFLHHSGSCIAAHRGTVATHKPFDSAFVAELGG